MKSSLFSLLFGSIEANTLLHREEQERIMRPIYERGSKIITMILIAHTVAALVLATVYSTWLVTVVCVVCALGMFLTARILLPESAITRSVAGISLQVFVALHIYQLHGMVEMHFFFFTGFTFMIVYQDWRSLWLGAMAIIGQHLYFAYLHNIGTPELYFFEEQYISPLKLIFHFGIALIHVATCALWSYMLQQQTLAASYNQSLLRNLNSTLEDRVAERTEELGLMTQHLQKQVEERTTMEMYLAESFMREERFSAMKAQFVTMLSHHIRTPLTMIKSGIDLITHIIERAQKNTLKQMISQSVPMTVEPEFIQLKTAMIKKQTGSINHGVDEIVALVHRIADLSDTQTRVIQSSSSVCSVHSIIDEVISDLSEKKHTPGLHNIRERICIINHDIPQIIANTFALKIILSEMLTNAAVFSSHSEEYADSPITITLDTTIINDLKGVRITIDNLGSHVPSGEEEHIFDYFYTAGEAATIGRHRGLGIGLGLVKFCVQVMEGRVLCSKNLLNQAQFIVEVPI